jgi:hypothetical protein
MKAYLQAGGELCGQSWLQPAHIFSILLYA